MFGRRRIKTRKDLKKNKKGFTLVEIIVVLLIIGILLAITIPSIMGYVGKAKDAQIQADARTGFVGAQTITAREVATNSTAKGSDIAAKITAATVNSEAGTNIVKYIKCSVNETSQKLEKCLIRVTDDKEKYVYFEAGSDGKAGDSKVMTPTEVTATDSPASTLAESASTETTGN